jgi:hypothetical protein
MSHVRNSDITVSLDQVVAIRSAEIERELLDRRTALQKRDREISNRLDALAKEYNAKSREICAEYLEAEISPLVSALCTFFPEAEATFRMNTEVAQSDEDFNKSMDNMFEVSITALTYRINRPTILGRPGVLAILHAEYAALIEEQQAGYAEMTEIRRGLAELPSVERQVRAAVAKHVLSQSPDKEAIMALLESVELPKSFTALLGHG